MGRDGGPQPAGVRAGAGVVTAPEWWCEVGDHPTDDPHTLDDTDGDVCPEHCPTCNGTATVTIDELRAATRSVSSPKSPLDPDGILGHGGGLTREQMARGEAS